MTGLSVIELFAGTQPDGNSVVERLQVLEQEDDAFILVKSPAFIKGIVRGDKIKLNKEDHSFELIARSGNLCIRVFAKEDIQQLAEDLTPPIEKLGGELDLENPRMLIYSIHVSCGFKQIEAILDDLIGEETNSAWIYGNVYDPSDGVTPLNWWKDILKPQ